MVRGWRVTPRALDTGRVIEEIAVVDRIRVFIDGHEELSGSVYGRKFKPLPVSRHEVVLAFGPGAVGDLVIRSKERVHADTARPGGMTSSTLCPAGVHIS